MARAPSVTDFDMKLRLILPILLLPSASTSLRAESLQADASVLYALHQWNTAGFSADIGTIIGGRHFVGLEWTYFNPKGSVQLPVGGRVDTSETINLAQLAYRYSLPVESFGRVADLARVEVFLGAGGGIGLVHATLAYSPVGSGGQTKPEICYEGVAGVQVVLAPGVGARFGFRYIDSVNNVRLFNAGANTDTKTLEAGVTFRF